MPLQRAPARRVGCDHRCGVRRGVAGAPHRLAGSPAGSIWAIAGAPASAAAWMPTAASSIWARGRSCSAPTSRSPIPSIAVRSDPRARLRLGRRSVRDASISTRRNRSCTISTPTIATSPISTSCLPTPIRCWRAASCSTNSRSTRAAAWAAFRLDLLPGNWIVPYLAYDRDSGTGTGVTTFVTDANEFPVPNTMNDLTNLYRGGVRFELKPFHVTLEAGRDDVYE